MREEGEELVEVDDNDTIQELLPLFVDSIKEIVPEEAIIEASKAITSEDIQDILLQIQNDKENNE